MLTKNLTIKIAIPCALFLTSCDKRDVNNSDSTSNTQTTSNNSNSVSINSLIKYDSIQYSGKYYKTIKIGNQTWTAENLNYKGINSNIGHCYLDKSDSCEKYGRLYTWAEAMNIDSSYNEKSWNGKLPNQGICPTGWHIPSENEWSELLKNIDSTVSGKKLKSISGWNDAGNGTDEYGFRALPAGFANIPVLGFGGTINDCYKEIGNFGIWWSSTEENEKGALHRSIHKSQNYMTNFDMGKAYAYSVRCIKD